LDNLITQEEDAGNKGRPKVDKSGLYELAQKMLDEGSLVGFDDDKPLEEYTTKDFRELFEANFQERENQIRENTPREFFQALPEELQIAAKYVADGGTDLKGLFRISSDLGLYSGLVQPNYPSISGKPTNLLGHLLEKYQFVEPRHDLIAEALWLLADPNGYKNKVREIGSREAVQRTVKQLKTEEGRKLVNSSNDYKEEDRRTTSTKPQKTISRANMFKRF